MSSKNYISIKLKYEKEAKRTKHNCLKKIWIWRRTLSYKTELRIFKAKIFIILSVFVGLLCYIKRPDYNIKFAVFSCVFVLAYIFLKDFWYKYVIFQYKPKMMKDYYRAIRLKLLKIDKKTSKDNENVFVAKTINGSVIGTLESLLYLFSILSQKYSLIGVILAIRSYLSITSHPNKEESEFYIIGLIGSLIYSIILASIYIVLSNWIFEIPIVEEVSKFLFYKVK